MSTLIVLVLLGAVLVTAGFVVAMALLASVRWVTDRLELRRSVKEREARARVRQALKVLRGGQA